MMMLESYIQGVGISLAFILAIGAQNIFVLKQGLKGEHIFWVCFICAVSDSILIYLGVYGFSAVLKQYSTLILLAQYAGAAFLFIYALKHLDAAIRPLDVPSFGVAQASSIWPVILSCLAITWLNPHVYLDTVLLLGSISFQFEQTRIYFALGAMTASWLFFFSLGYAARLLLPILQSRRAWQIFDALIALIMGSIAYGLLRINLLEVL